MSLVNLDASAIIYFVEAASPFHSVAVQSIARFRGDPSSRLITSRLARLECRVKPLRESDEPLLAKYDGSSDAGASLSRMSPVRFWNGPPTCGLVIGSRRRTRFTSPRPSSSMPTRF